MPAHLRVLLCQVSQGGDALGADTDHFLTIQRDVAVAAQSDGEQVGGLDGRLVLAHGRALLADCHLPVLDERDVGRRAADIHHQCIIQPRQKVAANRAGCRSGVNRLDWGTSGELVAHQRAIAPHDHERCIDLAAFHGPAHSDDEILQHGQQRGVDGGRRGPFHRAQLGRKLVA